MYPIEVELLDCNKNGEETIIKAARVCYDSGDKSNPESDDKLIKHLIESGHHSCLEFGWVVMKIKCSRVVSHELVRHRLFSLAQRSQRFVNESEPDYVFPDEIINGKYANNNFHTYHNAMETAWNAYSSLIQSGVPKQIARYVLPNACMTEIVVGGNFREWRHFCQLRCSPKAQPEMREVASECLKILREIAPRIFEDVEG
jgi:thymidylate synthase (FAD)